MKTEKCNAISGLIYQKEICAYKKKSEHKVVKERYHKVQCYNWVYFSKWKLKVKCYNWLIFPNKLLG